MSYKKRFDHFVGKGGELRGSFYTTMFIYICNYYSGGEIVNTEYYYSTYYLNRSNITVFESEMKLEYPEYEKIELKLNRDNPYITYIWSALDD